LQGLFSVFPPTNYYGLTINMGGDDVSVAAIVFRKM
jgi:hypothetical protein